MVLDKLEFLEIGNAFYLQLVGGVGSLHRGLYEVGDDGADAVFEHVPVCVRPVLHRILSLRLTEIKSIGEHS